jgi:hypothetical protein
MSTFTLVPLKPALAQMDSNDGQGRGLFGPHHVRITM